MSVPNFGMSFSRPADEPVPVLGADFSKILLIEASSDADVTAFPIGTPVRFSTSDAATVAKLGTGPLRDAVRGVADQLIGVNRGADVTVWRVAEGANAAATAANIVAALERVSEIPAKVNATPRLLWAGRTAYRLNLDTVGPVVAALPAACEKLLAIAIVDVDDTSAASAIDARETMNSERLMPVGVAARVYEGANLVTRPMGPRVLGIITRTDNAHEGRPFHPFANQVVNGIAGLSRPIAFSLLDGATEGQQLLEADVAIVATGEILVDGSIADGGFVFIGTENTATGDLWAQIHQVRGADYVTVMAIRIIRQFLGQRITVNTVEALVNSLRFMLRDLKVADDILGYNRDVFIPDQNSPEQIRLGRLKLDIGIEPAPVFKRAAVDLKRYRPAVDELVRDIFARLGADA